ncbi:MAG TPA: hypothetical protein VF972_09575 [Actinomycetota bacterium]
MFPVLPVQSDQVRNFGQEVGSHKDEWERLNREATVTRYGVWLQEIRMGDFAIHVLEVDDPTKIRQVFTQSAHDNWWLDYLKDVHGIDLRNIPADQQPTPPPQMFGWPG